VLLDERPYGVTAWAYERGASTGSPHASGLAALGGLPITVPLVAAASTASRADIAALAAGDVWLPCGGWFSDGPAAQAGPRTAALDRLVLAAPDGERGVRLERSDGGPFVLRSGGVALHADAEASAPRATGAEMEEPEETLKEIALDAPVVVRVEVGSVTLPARAWSELRPGDVLETGVRIAEPVVLRIAGHEVARGELVDVDGEVGVRIRELVVPAERP
jgi:type III secretion system YscQ/HrcQ family protein